MLKALNENVMPADKDIDWVMEHADVIGNGVITRCVFARVYARVYARACVRACVHHARTRVYLRACVRGCVIRETMLTWSTVR